MRLDLKNIGMGCHIVNERKVIVMGNACSTLGEGVPMTYLLSPLSTVRANNHAQEDTPPQNSSEPRWMSHNWGRS
jgi:hypothetical protein